MYLLPGWGSIHTFQLAGTMRLLLEDTGSLLSMTASALKGTFAFWAYACCFCCLCSS
jgi:hypothetical protein